VTFDLAALKNGSAKLAVPLSEVAAHDQDGTAALRHAHWVSLSPTAWLSRGVMAAALCRLRCRLAASFGIHPGAWEGGLPVLLWNALSRLGGPCLPHDARVATVPRQMRGLPVNMRNLTQWLRAIWDSTI